MLFFKAIKDEKLADPEFMAFYHKECHLCVNTIKIISLIEERKEDLDTILKTLEISSLSYEALKSGDHCQPEQVLKLCQYLKIEGANLVRDCPRL